MGNIDDAAHGQPQLVADPRSIGPVDRGFPLEPARREAGRPKTTRTQQLGDPRIATAEKGETLFRVFSDDVVAFIAQVPTIAAPAGRKNSVHAVIPRIVS